MQQRCANVKELRKSMIDAGLNEIQSLSKASGVNRNTLGEILSGKRQPSADVMYRLTVSLNLSPDRAGAIFFSQELT